MMPQLSLTQPMHLFVSDSLSEADCNILTTVIQAINTQQVSEHGITVTTTPFNPSWVNKLTALNTAPASWVGFLSEKDLTDPSFLQLLTKNPSLRNHCAVITHHHFEEIINDLHASGLYTVLHPNRPEWTDTLQAWLAFQQDGTLRQILPPHLIPHCLTSSTDIQNVFKTIRHECDEHQVHDIDSFSTALMEGLTNAVYHAPRHTDSTGYYIKGETIPALPPEHQVDVKTGMTAHGYHVYIHDPCGTLNPNDVLYWLKRNVSGEGLLDSHGRGFFLMHQLTDQIIVAIHSGYCCEILMTQQAISQTLKEPETSETSEASEASESKAFYLFTR